MFEVTEAADKNKKTETLSKNQADGNEKVDREHQYQSTMNVHIFAGKIRDARCKRDPTKTSRCKISTGASLSGALTAPPPSLGSNISELSVGHDKYQYD